MLFERRCYLEIPEEYCSVTVLWSEHASCPSIDSTCAFQTTSCCSVAKSCLTLFEPMDCRMPGFPVLHYPPGICWNSCPLSWWCHPIISFSAGPFSSCLQSFSASGSFTMSQFFTSGGQSIGVSASASVLLMNIQGWFPLGLTGWIFSQSMGLSRPISNTTVQKHHFFSAQLCLWPDSHIHTWLLEKP